MSDVTTEPEKDKDKQSNSERRISDIELKRAILKAVQEKKRAELKRVRAGRTRGRSALKAPYGTPVVAKVIEKESYIFSPKELFSLYVTSPHFREIFDSGRYIYVNNRLVMKSKECICISEGNIETIVRDNELNQYCLSKSVLATVLIPAGTGPVRIPKKNLEHKVYSFKDAEKIDSIKSFGNNNLYLFFGGGQEPPNNFNDAFVYFMDSRGITVEQLSAETGVSTKTIQRMRSKPNPQPTLQSLVAVSIGLHLSMYQSGMLLRFAGFSLDGPNPLFQAYSLCLNMACNSTVEECNYFLIQMGQKPLTKLYNKEIAKSLPKLKIVPPFKPERNNKR